MILVTGGAGYIGSHIVLALLDRGEDVVVYDNLSTGFAALVPTRARFEQGDCADRQRLDSVLAQHRPHAIVHCAASISVVESTTDPALYYRNNVANALNVLEAAVAAGAETFLFSSTATVYGDAAADRLHEGLPIAPVNPYAASKALFERVLLDIAAATPLKAGILRYFNVAGADPQGRSGQVSRRATHLIKLAAQAALSSDRMMQVTGSDFDTPDGTGIRDYIHITDLAAAHLAALDHLASHPGPLVLNIGYGHGASVLGVLNTLDKVLGRKVPRQMAPRRPGDVARLVADNSRALALLDWQPAHDDLATIITHALAWERHLLADPSRWPQA
jgi:UDP-glucose 4-epimerase